VMKGAILGGFMPPEWTMQKLDNLYKQMTEGYYPGEGDFGGDISVARYQTEEIARQSFKNMALMPTQGFNVPIPGGVELPGVPSNISFTELLKSNAYGDWLKKSVPKEQLQQLGGLSGLEKQLEKAKIEIDKVQKQMTEQVRSSLEKSGVKYKETKYLGYDAICAEGRNPTPPPKPKLSSRKTSDVEGGGGFDDRLEPLPKIPQPYAEKTTIYQAMLVTNFVITGSLLWAVATLPSGNTPCYSLTQFKKKTTVIREAGEVFTDIAIVPLVSNYAKEGYLHKEEVEKILKTITEKLKNN